VYEVIPLLQLIVTKDRKLIDYWTDWLVDSSISWPKCNCSYL